MYRRFKVYGQGINSDFKYTGDYDDSPFFGYLSYDEVIRLVSRLPPYPLQASEEELCPPTITILDENGNDLSISATPEIGKYDIFYVGDRSGDVESNVSIKKVREILRAYYSGSPLGVESYEERILRSDEEQFEVLAYIPGIEEIIEDKITWSGRTEHVSITFERDKSSNEIYANIKTIKGTIKIPLDRIMEVKFVRGGFWTHPHIELKYRDKNDHIREHTMRLDKEDKKRINDLASNVSKILPGKVKIK